MRIRRLDGTKHILYPQASPPLPQERLPRQLLAIVMALLAVWCGCLLWLWWSLAVVGTAAAVAVVIL